MTETRRYVAYYRMPSIGNPLDGDTLARQRRDIVGFLDHPDRVLVGEFTEVMTPLYEGETSPAFDLSLECCRNLDARLVCAVAPADLTPSARLKAAHNGIRIDLIGPDAALASRQEEPVVVPKAGHPPDIQSDSEPVPYLRLGRGQQNSPQLRPARKTVAAPAGNRAKADRFAAAILPVIEEIKRSGVTTLTDIADALNARNIRTARGRRWYPTTVKNILDRKRQEDTPC